MLVLDTFGPAFGLPDPSPFVMKAMVLLKMAGLEHETRRGDVRKAPKGKFPVLHDDGVVVPDTTFIRWHLETAHGIDFDLALSDEQKAVGWAVEKMLEDNLYWAVVHERWVIDENFDKGPRQFFQVLPAPMRPLIIWMVRRQVARDLKGQGMARHDRSEIIRIGKTSLKAVSDILGQKPYLLGENPSGADATAYAFLANALCDHFESPLLQAADECPNLAAYCARMTERYFPELSK